MKKFLTMLLALVMVLSLAACSSQKGGDVNGGFPASAVDLMPTFWTICCTSPPTNPISLTTPRR